MNRRNSSREGSAKTDPSLYFPHISRVGSLREFLSPESFFGFLSRMIAGLFRLILMPAGKSVKKLRKMVRKALKKKIKQVRMVIVKK